MQGGLDWLEQIYRGERSRHALQLSLLFALAYAWALFCTFWGLGLIDGTVLGQEILPPLQSRLRVLAGPGLGLLPPALFVGIRWLSQRIFHWYQAGEKQIRKTRRRWLWPFRLTVSIIAVAVAGAGGMVFAFAFSFGIAVAVAGAVADDVAVAVAVTVAVAAVGAGAIVSAATVVGAVARGFAGAELKDDWKLPIATPIVDFMVGTVGVFGILALLFGEKPEQAIVFISFQLVLPLINGLTDWLSLWASRYLARTLLDQMRERDHWQLFRRVIVDFILDLAAALLFLAFLAFSLAFLMQAISEIRSFGYDVTVEIARAAADPLGEGIWLAAILFSTLIPTAVHALLLLLSPLSLYGPPRAERIVWAETLESPHFRLKNTTCQQIAHAAARWSIERNDLWAILTRYGAVLGCYVLAAWGTWQLWRLIFGPGFGPADAIAFIAELGVRAVPF